MRISRTRCIDCGELIPKNGSICPQCGTPRKLHRRIIQSIWKVIELLALIATTGAIAFLVISYNQMDETIELQEEQMTRGSAQQIVEDSVARSEIGLIQTQISLIGRQLEIQERSSALQNEQSQLSRIKITAEQKPYVLALGVECSTDSTTRLYRTRIVIGNIGKSVASNTTILTSTAVSSPKAKDLIMTDSSFCGDLVPNRPFIIDTPFGDSTQLGRLFSVLESDDLVLYIRIEASWRWNEMALTERSTRYFELRIPTRGRECSSSLISEFDALRIFKGAENK